MSIENLKEYARRCAVEPELRDVAKTIGSTDLDSHMEHAGSLGLEWTSGDLEDFRIEFIEAQDEHESLSEDELELIAGGGATVTAVVVGAVVGAVAGAAVAGTAAGGAAAASGDGGW